MKNAEVTHAATTLLPCLWQHRHAPRNPEPRDQTVTLQQLGWCCLQCGEALLTPEDLAATRDPLYQLLQASERSGEISLDDAIGDKNGSE